MVDVQINFRKLTFISFSLPECYGLDENVHDSLFSGWCHQTTRGQQWPQRTSYAGSISAIRKAFKAHDVTMVAKISKMYLSELYRFDPYISLHANWLENWQNVLKIYTFIWLPHQHNKEYIFLSWWLTFFVSEITSMTGYHNVNIFSIALSNQNSSFYTLTLKHRETHGCVVSTVATDALVLKHQAISILRTD